MHPSHKLVIEKLTHRGFVRVVRYFLTATKGWKVIGAVTKKIGIDEWNRAKLRDTFYVPSKPEPSFGRLNNTGWWRRNATISPMVVTERMLMRHGWWRRKLRQQGIAIEPGAKNAMVLR